MRLDPRCTSHPLANPDSTPHRLAATWPDVGLLCRFVDFQATSATPLSQVLPENADSNAAALLGALLGDGMNPNKRLAAAEALEHRYFEVQPEPTPPSQLPR